MVQTLLRGSQTLMTTILAVRRNGRTVIMADGQMDRGSLVMKSNAKKLRLNKQAKCVVGLSGSSADCLTLMNRLDEKLKDHPDNLMKACTELAKMWRTNKILRHFNASLVVANSEHLFLVSGNGLVMSADEGVCWSGSGGNFARAAALALFPLKSLTSDDVCESVRTCHSASSLSVSGLLRHSCMCSSHLFWTLQTRNSYCCGA